MDEVAGVGDDDTEAREQSSSLQQGSLLGLPQSDTPLMGLVLVQDVAFEKSLDYGKHLAKILLCFCVLSI
eukprot:JP447701.1.p4 GENE.JP447701.1~~JP447701.1.p4  ORF type:complete len:70 (+),score=12.85 JP447701.1:313-522(+)